MPNPAERKIKAALEKAAELHRNGDEPNTAVAKAASQYELNPEMTCRVVEGFNIGKTNTTIAKAEDKTASFPIADATEVLGQVFGGGLKSASVMSKSASAADVGYTEVAPEITIDWVGNQKTASEAPEFRETMRQINGLDRQYAAELSKIAQDQMKHEMGMGDSLRQLVEHFRQSDQIGKFAEFEQQVLSEYGEQAKPDLDLIHENAGLTEARYDGGLPKVGSIYFQPAAANQLFDTYAEHMTGYFAAQAEYGTKLAQFLGELGELNNLAKEAAGIPRTEPATAADALLFKSGGAPKEGLFSVEAPAHTLFSAAQSGVEGATGAGYQAAHTKALENRYKGPKDEVSMETDNAKRQMILVDLLSNDDIISKQPREQMMGAYNTVLGIAPDVTLQPEIIRAFLRSASAQQSVDPFTATQMGQLQNVLTKNKMLQSGKAPAQGL